MTTLERAVTLSAKLPVHIGYWTAWVQPDGSVTFTDDPYGRDRVHARLMENKNSTAEMVQAVQEVQ